MVAVQVVQLVELLEGVVVGVPLVGEAPQNPVVQVVAPVVGVEVVPAVGRAEVVVVVGQH